MEANKLSVLSLNCWGLYLVSRKRKFRLEAIAEAIRQLSCDIVTLQEIWVYQDFNHLKNHVSTELPYAKYFYSGALGSGLAILSKYPITYSSYFRYTLAGRPLKVFHGDYYVGKGCASVCLEHPLVGVIQVFTTHLHAGYGKSDEYRGHRITESWELANILRSAAAQGRQIIATGDFNSTPTSYNYRLLKEHAFMTDSWLETHLDSQQQNWQQTENEDLDDFIQRFGITCNSSSNTWSKHFNPQPHKRKATGDRLDYIFYRRTPQMICTDSFVTMTKLIPGSTVSYSDHFGVQSNFILNGDDDFSKHNGYMNNHYKTISTTSNASMLPPSTRYPSISTSLSHPTYTALDLTTVQELILLLQKDQLTMQRMAHRLLRTFISLVVIVLALYVAIVIVPYRVSVNQFLSHNGDGHHHDMLIVWLLPLLLGIPLIICSVLAIVCLIVGFVFGYGEHQAMHQFVIDLQTLLHGLQLRNKDSTISSSSPTTPSQLVETL
ncbi:Endonuclease/exonuclease/phosphatase [Halteromyces radiatus]|uniref:Endonuclease/exonuclease/phosphatase n=1 Tax=Halteromyces radiatus TaxID=101107 RepID=UPI00222041B7|nr:Endonuclease/exonuclease/phosphatase [Halteromyces radiatus]KAI8092679.1 Endonuclease/exonuclease/phosphatase [Halteromyces radiatus]